MSDVVRDMTMAQASRDIRAGRLSPVTLMERCLARIAACDGHLHAMVAVAAEQALQDAHAAEAALRAGRWSGPLHGIPLGIKDVIDVVGIPTRSQSRVENDWTGKTPSVDAAAVARLRAAGAIVIGKLTTHEFAFGSPQCTPVQAVVADVPTKAQRASGPLVDERVPGPAARNPWDRSRFAGGSSSGAAVGVAAGMMLGALGTDTAGSVRSPAALCGVTGFKPSRARIDRRGCVPLAASLDSVGVLASTAEDCALMYDALQLPVREKSAAAPFEWASNRGAAALAGVRIGVVRHFMHDGVPISDACAAAIEQAAAECAAAGAIIETAVLPALERWQASGMTILLAEAYALHAPYLATMPERYGDSVAEAISMGAFLTPRDVQHARERQATLTASVETVLSQYDVLLAPIQPGEAPLFDGLRQWGFLERPSYGLPFNVADLPALSLCCGFGENGLPLSLQWVGRRGAEADVLAVADAYQQRTAWHRHGPMGPG